ncbi:MAG: hypothetical protein IKM87_04375 [Clostridia bacterium]|nr:hypothetical protein [Clostridia bacterium]
MNHKVIKKETIMKRNSKCILLLAIIFGMLMNIIPAYAAGSVSIKASSPVHIGDTFTATITFSGGDQYVAAVEAKLSYDSDKLKYVSSSGDGEINIDKKNILLDTGSPSKKTLSIKIKFKALAEGEASIGVSGATIAGWDGEIGTYSKSKKITITKKEEKPETDPVKPDPVKPDPVKPDPVKPDPVKPDPITPSEPVVPEEVKTAIPIDIYGEKQYLWRTLTNVKLPENFTMKTIVYDGEQVQAAVNEANDLTIMYFTDEKGTNGSFYIYNGYNQFYKFKEIEIGGNHYIPLNSVGDEELPKGYNQSMIELNGESILVWSNTDKPDFSYIYALNRETNYKGLYVFENNEKTIQRADRKALELILESEKEENETIIPIDDNPTPEPEPQKEPEKDTRNVFERILDDNQIMVVLLSILGAALVIIAIMTGVIIVNKKKRKARIIARKRIMSEAQKEADDFNKRAEKTLDEIKENDQVSNEETAEPEETHEETEAVETSDIEENPEVKETPEEDTEE